jgi:hypothetical protein
MADTSAGGRGPAQADKEKCMRGKAAAQNANRRVTEAQERISSLEAQLRDAEARYRNELEALRTERDQARGRLIREVDSIAAATIEETNQAAAEAVRAAEERCTERIVDGFAWLTKALGDRIPRDLEGCARAFRVDVSQLINATNKDGVFNRRSRRMSNKKMRDLSAFYADAANSGRPVRDIDIDLKAGQAIFSRGVEG